MVSRPKNVKKPHCLSSSPAGRNTAPLLCLQKMVHPLANTVSFYSFTSQCCCTPGALPQLSALLCCAAPHGGGSPALFLSASQRAGDTNEVRELWEWPRTLGPEHFEIEVFKFETSTHDERSQVVPQRLEHLLCRQDSARRGNSEFVGVRSRGFHHALGRLADQENFAHHSSQA